MNASKMRVREQGCIVSSPTAGVEEKKNTADLVTETDQNTEKLVMGEIKKKYPTHK